MTVPGIDLMTCDLYDNRNFVAFAEAAFGPKWQQPFSQMLGVSQALVSMISNDKAFIKTKTRRALDSLDRAALLNGDHRQTHTNGAATHTHYIVPARNQQVAVAPVAPLDPAIIKEQIEQRFADCFDMAQSVIDMILPSLIVSGAPGIGKTHGIMDLIEKSGVENYIIKGPCSAINLYKALYEMKDGGVVVLDDSDSIFRDEATLNMLKHATDSTETRVISYEKRLQEIEDGTYPKNFEFNGGMIFISNKDFHAEIDRQTKDAVHLEALLDRAAYIDLGIRAFVEKMIRLRQGVNEFGILGKLGIEDSAKAGEEIVAFIEKNANNIPEISFRLLIAAARLYKAQPKDWERLTLVTRGRMPRY